MSVSLSPASSRAPLGTVITWSPQAGSVNDDEDILWYRYRVRRLGEDFHMVRDFGPEADLVWTAMEHEGAYEMEVTVRNITTGDLATDVALFEMAPLATDTLAEPTVATDLNGNILWYYQPRNRPRSSGRVSEDMWPCGSARRAILPTTPTTCTRGFRTSTTGTSSAEPLLLPVFDNGNVRRATDPTAHSRGQVIRLDEQNRVATLVVNADLGAYSFALGSAHLLPSGNYHFDLGWTPTEEGRAASQAVEVAPSGEIVYGIQAATPEYRSFRRQSLYAP